MKILLVEDQFLFREALRKLLAGAGFTVAGEAADGRDALALLPALKPALVILDLELPIVDGFSVIEGIRAGGWQPKIMVLSSFCDDYTVLRLEKLQVDAFVDKNRSASQTVVEACRTVAQGRKFFSPTFTQVRLGQRQNTMSFDKILSDREQEVLALIGELRTDDEIAQRLGIHPRTAETHRFHIMKKLNLATRADLQKYARDHGFIQSAVRGIPGSGLR